MRIYIAREVQHTNRGFHYSTLEVFADCANAEEYVESHAATNYGVGKSGQFFDVTSADANWSLLAYSGEADVLGIHFTWEILCHDVVPSKAEMDHANEIAALVARYAKSRTGDEN